MPSVSLAPPLAFLFGIENFHTRRVICRRIYSSPFRKSSNYILDPWAIGSDVPDVTKS
jgi:hypothetical protein